MKRLIALTAALLALAGGWPATAQEGAEFKAPDEIETHLIRVLRTTNKAQTNRYVPKVYNMENVNPYDVVRFIRRTMEIEEGAWFLFGKPQDPKDPNRSVRSGKAVVIAPLYQIPSIDELMATIDVPGLTSSSGDEMYYYRPKHRHVEDRDWTNLITAVADTALEGDEESGDFVADDEVNAFLFYDSPGSIADVQRWMPVLDQPPPQAMIEATLYEVNVENDDALGLDYVAWKNGPGRDLFTAGLFWQKERVPTLTGTGDPLLDTGVGTFSLDHHAWKTKGAHYSYFLDVPGEFFDFLVTKQKARVLTSTKLLTRNRRTALLESSDSIFFWRVAEDGGFDAFPDIRDGIPLESGKIGPLNLDGSRIVVGDQRPRRLGSVETGVFMEVSPLVGTKGINLAIDLDIVGHSGFGTSGEPQLVRRNFNTEVRVQDGQEIVLGGYDRQMVVQQTNKIPVLGSLPVLGWLFGGEQNLVKNRKVVVVLRAGTVKDFSAMGGAGTDIDAALIRARARREWPTKALTTEWGFDQWLLDPEPAQ